MKHRVSTSPDSDRLALELLKKVGSENELLSALLQLVLRATRADAVDLFLRADDRNELVHKATTRGDAADISDWLPICNRAVSEGSTQLAWLAGSGLAANHARAARLIATPLLDEGYAFGALLLRLSPRKQMGQVKIQAMESIGRTAAATLRAYHHLYEAGSRLNRIGAVSEVARIITQSPYLEEILQLLVNMTAQQFDYRVCTVRLLDESAGELVLRATQATAKAYQRKRAIKLGESIAGQAIAKNRPIVVRDVREEETYIGHDLAVEQGLLSMICVPLTIQGRPVGVMSCYTDVIREFPRDEIKALETIAKQAALSIEHAKLQVRSTLMQEMHHRVKNNLQQVASLLRLQIRQSEDEKLEAALNGSLARILAIASVHDLLSRDDLDHVGVRSIAESLVKHQQQSFILPGKRIQFSIRGHDVPLNINDATRIGLILNELIQNAIEHGFATCDEGEVHVNIEYSEGEVGLWVSNNGDALPVGFDAETGKHLGLSIVDSLSRSLGGRFTLRDSLGWTVAELKFARVCAE